jgi:hypothetical protein
MEVFLIFNRHPKVPHVPFAPIVPLFLEPADSELYAFLKEVHTLIETAPSLVDAVEKDLDAHGLRKKEGRLVDKEWLANQTPNLSGLPEPDQSPDKPLMLGQGRPRTSGYVVLVALFLRGYLGAGFKSADVSANMVESITLRVFFSNLGVNMPSRSTLTELVNAVSLRTRLLVLDAQIARALDLNLDDSTSTTSKPSSKTALTSMATPPGPPTPNSWWTSLPACFVSAKDSNASTFSLSSAAKFASTSRR